MTPFHRSIKRCNLWQKQLNAYFANKPGMRLSKGDPSSYSEPEKVIINNIEIDWAIDFETKTIDGNVHYSFETKAPAIREIVLDVKEIKIELIQLVTPANKISLNFEINNFVENIGSKLIIFLPKEMSGTFEVTIKYKTSNEACALQWLTPKQTLGKIHPYMFSQCQSIHARSILPCQDTPAAKFTYKATIHHPKELTALMSAIRVKSEPGVTYFEQSVCIPSYLLAIAVGCLVSKDIGPISKVWAEKEILDEAAEEFSQTSDFLKIAEEICGPYVWKQYDLLVMPPSFPFGGMENPCLTFVTPTLIAGDKSLATVVAHEIVHSWTGNLVTNRNFEHFWLNEGFTVFVEQKILGRIGGSSRRDFESSIGLMELNDTIKEQIANKEGYLSKLVLDLTDISPDDAYSTVPYQKGCIFIRYLEDMCGGPTIFEPFLKNYLNRFKFQSIVSDDFKNALLEYFIDGTHGTRLGKIDWEAWLYGEGMPPELPVLDSSLTDVCQKHAKLWIQQPASVIKSAKELQEKLKSFEIVYVLGQVFFSPYITNLNRAKIDLMAKTYNLNETKNSEIRFIYLRLCILARLKDKKNDILAFLNSNFRMKFVRPIYKDLSEWTEMRQVAIDNFNKVKDQMMQMCAIGIAKELGI